jgi:hypothetical protein
MGSAEHVQDKPKHQVRLTDRPGRLKGGREGHRHEVPMP